MSLMRLNFFLITFASICMVGFNCERWGNYGPNMEFSNTPWGNWVGIGLSYRPTRLHRLAESIPGVP